MKSFKLDVQTVQRKYWLRITPVDDPANEVQYSNYTLDGMLRKLRDYFVMSDIAQHEFTALRDTHDAGNSAKQCSSCVHKWQGMCHRFPPVVDKSGFIRHPEVDDTDYCGEWKSK